MEKSTNSRLVNIETGLSEDGTESQISKISSKCILILQFFTKNGSIGYEKVPKQGIKFNKAFKKMYGKIR